MDTISEDSECQATAGIRSPAFSAMLFGFIRFLRVICNLWHSRARERRRLARLDARMLRDIGVSAEDAARESAKPFWRA